MRDLVLLVQFENEITYIIENLLSGYVAGAREGVEEMQRTLVPLPISGADKQALKTEMERIEHCFDCAPEDALQAASALVSLRRRTANQVAVLMKKDLPYTLSYYPLLYARYSEQTRPLR